MTKEERKQRILEILDKLGIVIGWTETGWQKTITKEDCADEILSIPLDVPKEAEIDEFVVLHPDNTRNFILGAGISAGFKVGAEWAIDEIKKRNQK